jgi:acyl CoA:acetate/3-ketoacid CoA transferase alpha subunit
MFEIRGSKRGKEMIKSYKDLEVYKNSYQAALELHQTTLEFPKHELYELGSQLRRAGTSIPLNIAEDMEGNTQVMNSSNTCEWH